MPCIRFPPLDLRLNIPRRGSSNLLARRVCEANEGGSFLKAARIMTTHAGVAIDVKQAQLITERVGRRLRQERDEATRAYFAHERPRVRHAPLDLLVATADGGRVQTRQDDPDEKWKEDKIGVIYDAVPRPEQEGQDYLGPLSGMRSVVATMGDWDELGRHLSALADLRGRDAARQVIFTSDGAKALRSQRQTHFKNAQFVLDWNHAKDHIKAAAYAVFGTGNEAERWIERQSDRLWNGRRKPFFADLRAMCRTVGRPSKKAKAADKRKIAANTLGYFTDNCDGIDYPTYRKNGWPIASTMAETHVKQLGRRVKGADKHWNIPGAEDTLQVMADMQSTDGSWERFWADRTRAWAA
jgi:hypothetical protein